MNQRAAWPILAGLWAAIIALVPGIALKLILASLIPVCFLIWFLFKDRDRWLTGFFFCAILLPPLPIALGNSGPHIAPVFAVAGVLVSIVTARSARIVHSRLILLFGVFLGALLISECFGAFYAKPDVALLGLARIALLAITPFVVFHMLTTSRMDSVQVVRFSRWLFRMAVAAGLFACADFYFQFPSPAGFGPQFVWLDNEVLRRAQGLFYEASTLGNFCAFFLVFALVMFLAVPGMRPCRRIELMLGAPVLGCALVLSYSRGSLITLACAVVALLVSRRGSRKTFLVSAAAFTAGIAVIIWGIFPAYWNSYMLRLEASLLYFHSEPAAVLSGRLASWSILGHFAATHPGTLVFGIGYKTLPYSNYVGSVTVADNTYLDLLIETGVVGLLAFLALNAEMLRVSWRAAAKPASIETLLSQVFFCFWIGELVQMLSGDLITYWRVLPVYLWVLGAGLRTSPRVSC